MDNSCRIAVVGAADKVFDQVVDSVLGLEPAVHVTNAACVEAAASAALVMFDAPAHGNAGLDELTWHGRRSRMPIAVFTATPSVDSAVACVRAGARGYLRHESPAAHLGAAIEQLLAGKAVVDPVLGGELLQALGRTPAWSWSGMSSGLTRREGEILDLLRRGLTNREMADLLVLGTQTVKSHVHRVYRKLGVTGRVDLG